MSPSRTTTIQPAIEAFVVRSSAQIVHVSSRRPYATCVHVALTGAAMAIQCMLPVVWVVMPDNAVAIACLASGCSTLAARIA